MSTNLHEAQLKYPRIEKKKACVVFRTIKHFRSYILKIHTKVIIPRLTLRSLFVKQDLGEKRGNWITTIQEYDIEKKPAKLVSG